MVPQTALSALALSSALLCGRALALHAPHISVDSVPHKYEVTGIAGMGDSYNGMPGDGGVLPEDLQKCSVWGNSPEYEIFDDKRLKFDRQQGLNVYPVVCTGVTAANLPSQAKKIGSDANVVLVSVGFNDAAFSGVLNSCVYGIYQTDETCHDAQRRARMAIKAKKFTNQLQAGIDAIFAKSKNANIYFFGYPTFFNTDTTQCDKACFQVDANGECDSEFLLTQARRKNMNNITGDINDVIQNVVNKNHGKKNKSTQFINIDKYFEGHRFCEDGVTEPDYNNPSSWLYPFSDFNTDWTTDFDSSPCADYSKLVHFDFGDLFTCGAFNRGTEFINTLASNSTYMSTKFKDPGSTSGKQGSPDFWNRIFHPTNPGATAYHNAFMQRYLDISK